MRNNRFHTYCLLGGTIIALMLSFKAAAQTYQQRGTVRMITNSATSPTKPVSGVKVAIGGQVSGATKADGTFKMQVTKQFQVNGITPNEYVLAFPTKGKTYYQSANDLDVVVTTRAQRDMDFRRMYNQLKAKYDEQSDRLMAMKRKLRRQLDEMNAGNAEYVRVKASLDSVQALYMEYVNNEEKIDKEIRNIADELALTDYQTLDSLNQRIYELKCAGEWKSISELMREVMHGDAVAFLQQGLRNKAQAEAELKAAKEQETAAERDLKARFKFMLSTIESFKMQHLNDSASLYYKILTDAAPDNGLYLNEAGLFEERFIGNYTKAIDYYTRALPHLKEKENLSACYNNIGLAYYLMADYPRALENLRLSLKIKSELKGPDNSSVAYTYNNLGLTLSSLSRNDEALECYTKALKIEQSLARPDYNNMARAYHNIGAIYSDLCKYKMALKNYNQALEIRDKHSKNEDDRGTTYANLGIVYNKLGQYQKALEYYDKAYKINSEVYGSEHPDMAQLYTNIGETYSEMGEYDKALEYLHKAQKIEMERLGEKHIHTIYTYINLGSVYMHRNNLDKAMEYTQKALEISRELIGENCSEVACCYSNIGAIYMVQEQWEKVLQYTQKALDIDLAVYGDFHPHVAEGYMAKGTCLLSMGKESEAMPFLQKALQTYTDLFGEEHKNVGMLAELLSGLYFEAGDTTQAIEYCRKAINIRTALYGEFNDEVMRGYTMLGAYYYKLGDTDKMVEYLSYPTEIMARKLGEDNEKVKQMRQNVKNLKKQVKQDNNKQ